MRVCTSCGINLRRIALKGKIYDMCPDPKCGMQDEPEGIKIDTVYLFVTEDDKGNETLVSHRSDSTDGRTYTPMVAADLQRVVQLLVAVPEIEQQSGRKVKLLTFTVREELLL